MAVRVGDLEGRLRLNTAQWDRGMARMRSSVGRAQQSMQQASAAVSVWGRRVGIAFAAAGAASIKMAADFETSMTKIITLVGVAEDQVNQWRATVLKMAADTGKAPKELSDALFVVTSAGIRGAESLDVLRQAARASAIGLGETAAIARAVTSAVQAYGAENLSAQRAVEIMTATVREGNLEASSLASTLGRVIPIASQLGITFENVGAFLATFTRLGVSAEESITGLRGTLQILLKPTTAATKALEEVGLSMADLRRVAREEGLPEALGLIVEAFKGQDEQLAMVIPNVRALAGVLGTAGAQGEQFAQILDSISNSTGIVDEGFARVQQTTAFAFNQFIANVKVLAIQIGTTLLPVATKILDWATELVKKTDGFTDALDRQLPVVVAWGKFALEAVKFTALAFAALVRVAFNVGQLIGDAFQIAANVQAAVMLKAVETIIAHWRVLAVVGGVIFAPLGAAMELLADQFPDLEGKSQRFFDQAAEQAENFKDNLGDVGRAVNDVGEAFDDLRLAAGRALQTVARGGGVGAGPGAPTQRFPTLRGGGVRARQLGVSPLSARNVNKELSGFGKFLKKANIQLEQFANSLVAGARAQLDPGMILSDLATQGIGTLVSKMIEGIGRVFQPSEEEQALQAALERNVEALQNLSRSIDAQAAIVAGAPGGLLSKAREAITLGFAGSGAGRTQAEAVARVQAEMEKLGLTMDDMRRVAGILGIEFVESAAGFVTMAVALEQLSISDLFESFAGQLDILQRRFALFDVKPADQLIALRDKFLEAVELDPAIEAQIRALDLSSAEGRAAFATLLQDVFGQFESGALTLGNLGELSATQFLDMLNSMESLGDEIDSTTDGFRSLTQELLNVPRGFKIAAQRFVATTGLPFGTVDTGVPGIGTQTFSIQTVNIQAAPGQSGEELWQEVARAARRQGRRGGTSDLDLALAQR